MRFSMKKTRLTLMAALLLAGVSLVSPAAQAFTVTVNGTLNGQTFPLSSGWSTYVQVVIENIDGQWTPVSCSGNTCTFPNMTANCGPNVTCNADAQITYLPPSYQSGVCSYGNGTWTAINPLVSGNTYYIPVHALGNNCNGIGGGISPSGGLSPGTPPPGGGLSGGGGVVR